MKKSILFFIFFCFFGHSRGQTVNCNPDPNGTPWTLSTVNFPTSVNCDNLTNFYPDATSLNTPLPVSVNNAGYIWWPFIVDQGDFNSCIQVAEIAYTFTYEINRKRNLDAGTLETDYPSRNYNQHYTYNQTVSGANQDSPWHSGFCLLQDNGCPTAEDFVDPVVWEHFDDGDDIVYTYWMTGTDKYIAGMDNRISEIYKFDFGLNTSDLSDLKHWIADHGRGESTGGLAVIGIFMYNYSYGYVQQPGGPYDGDRILRLNNSTTRPHALTIVGYDDNVPISPTEFGAFKVANSWNTNWGDLGFIWLPYSALVRNNSSLVKDYAYTCDVYPNEDNPLNEPGIAISANIEHDNRSDLMYYVAHDEINDTNPDLPETQQLFEAFTTNGNVNDMRGKYYSNLPIDLALNFSHFYTDELDTPFQRIFIDLFQKSAPLIGQVNSIKLIDNRWNEEFELSFQIDEPFILKRFHNWKYIDYYLLPHHGHFIQTYTNLWENRISRFTTEVRSATLNLTSDKQIDMYDGEIIINYASTLKLQDQSKIIAKKGWNKITIDGALNLYGSTSFIAEDDAVLEIFLKGSNFNLANVTFEGIEDGRIHLYLDNEQGTVGFNSSLFTNVYFTTNAANLIVDNCTFNTPYEYLNSSNGNVSFYNSTFDQYGLNLSNYDPLNYLEEKATVIGCVFNGSSEYFMDAIIVHKYAKYQLSNDTIQDYGNGIAISNSGNGRPSIEDQLIDNNIIYNCQLDGINAYNSQGKMSNNDIYNNYFGVRFMNDCNFEFTGNQYAHSYSETQQIRNNTSIEVYASEFSFPNSFRYNALNDPDNLGNPNDPIVKWDVPDGLLRHQADVRYNNWGTGFNASQDLGGSNIDFLVIPIWHISIGPPPPPPGDKMLYDYAISNFEDGNYIDAKVQYESLIEQYPTSYYAEASMKDLLRLEEFAGQDYTGLQDYYSTNDSIQSDSILTKLSEILVNDCNVKLENYSDAINWYENIIENPSNESDSIFAIIDLGYVYTLLELDELKSNYIGRFPHYKPKNASDFIKRKDHLLSLLPSKDSEQNDYLSVITKGYLFQTFPNPTNDKAFLKYTLDKESNVLLRLVDNLGKTVMVTNEGNKQQGIHQIEIDLTSLPTGIYFYTLFIDEKLADTKKLNIIR